jgi:hypothetical protein
MNDLIHITPELQFKVDCPNCGKGATGKELLFQGMHVLTKCNCNTNFYSTLPVGHDLLFPCSFDFNGKLFNATQEAKGWLIDPLIHSLTKTENQKVVQIEKEIKEQKEEAIILNCLDNCFGHVFYKLWNLPLLKSKYPNKSIIVFIPRKTRWLLPDTFSEVWLFDASFKMLENYLTNLDQEIKQNLLPRFKNVSLSKAYTHLSLDKINLKDFVKTDRFDLSKFNDLPHQITFVLREDRFWHRYRFEYFLFKVFVKLNLSKQIFIWRQNYLVDKVASLIKKNFPQAKLVATGLCRSGSLSSLIEDQRKNKLTESDEKNWCGIYSSSHVVVGIHGSNMLIPTALAAGFVEILPREKIKHISEDILLNRSSRYSIFLGRHVDHFSSPKLIARHISGILADFPYLYRNTEQE